MDESHKVVYSVFRNSANELSQLYSQAINHHRLSFEAGQRHALEKLSEWIEMKQQEGSVVTKAEIVAYIQNELNNDSNTSHAVRDGKMNEVNVNVSFPTILMQNQDKSKLM